MFAFQPLCSPPPHFSPTSKLCLSLFTRLHNTDTLGLRRKKQKYKKFGFLSANVDTHLTIYSISLTFFFVSFMHSCWLLLAVNFFPNRPWPPPPSLSKCTLFEIYIFFFNSSKNRFNFGKSLHFHFFSLGGRFLNLVSQFLSHLLLLCYLVSCICKV